MEGDLQRGLRPGTGVRRMTADAATYPLTWGNARGPMLVRPPDVAPFRTIR